jgi:CDP-glycerol glycerophosphotransferase (TagB/SpsB family)
MLLDAADILVTDYSSCFVDHLLLDRPQVFFAYDLDHYIAHERNLYGDFRKDATGRICEDQSALLDELMRISEGEDRYAGKRQEIRDFYYSRENQKAVSAKQVDTILQL